MRVHPRQRAVAGATLALLSTLVARAADPPGTPRANESLDVCSRARATHDADEKSQLAAHGLALAEQAVSDAERDPKAHFAVFCNLGTQMKQRGVSIQSLVAVRRLRREIDRTIELAPDWPDALVGKGSLLIELPAMLGGDPGEGERLLREALRNDPDFLTARVNLAHALADRGARDEARAEADRAAALAERKGDRDAAEDVRALRARLDAR